MAEKKPATKTPRPSKRAPSHIASVAQSVALLPKMLETALAELPAGFKVKDFEMVGDTLRIFGSVVEEPRGEAARPAPVDVEVGRLYEKQMTEPRYIAPIPTSPLMNAIGSYELRLEELSAALCNLERAAESVLLPGGGTSANGSNEGPQAAPAGAEAVDRLHGLNGRFERLIACLSDITQRVQA
jgi:hypothetical protein